MTDPFVLRRIAPSVGFLVAAALSVSGMAVAGAEGSVEPLACPDGLAVDAAGTLYVADVCTNRVLARSSAGAWRVFAGTGDAGYSGDEGPADLARLEYVSGVTLDRMGNVYLVECGGNVIRRVGPDGTITTVAGVGGMGAGQGGYAGDGGAATEAQLACPSDAAFHPVDGLFITDRENSVVRRVDEAGAIATVAGGGSVDAASASGSPATDVRFAPESPVQVVVDAAGSLYLADEPGHRVWKVDPSGIMTAFAGTGDPGFSGDGGPAHDAQLHGPYGLAIDFEGRLYVGDYENARIRRIGSDGVITTIAGSGEVGSAGDGGLATSAQLQSPYGLAVADDGTLYISDQENARIRVIDPTGVIDTLDP